MPCLIPIHGHPHQLFDVDSIQLVETDTTYNSPKGWGLYYEALPTEASFAQEYYSTKAKMKARLLQIERLVNSQCDTNIKVTIKK